MYNIIPPKTVTNSPSTTHNSFTPSCSPHYHHWYHARSWDEYRVLCLSV